MDDAACFPLANQRFSTSLKHVTAFNSFLRLYWQLPPSHVILNAALAGHNQKSPPPRQHPGWLIGAVESRECPLSVDLWMEEWVLDG